MHQVIDTDAAYNLGLPAYSRCSSDLITATFIGFLKRNVRPVLQISHERTGSRLKAEGWSLSVVPTLYVSSNTSCLSSLFFFRSQASGATFARTQIFAAAGKPVVYSEHHFLALDNNSSKSVKHTHELYSGNHVWPSFTRLWAGSGSRCRPSTPFPRIWGRLHAGPLYREACVRNAAQDKSLMLRGYTGQTCHSLYVL
jgi:hypothetical protein